MGTQSAGPAEIIRLHPVRVARKDVPAFETLPDDFRGDPAIIVYGEVQRGPDSAYVRLIGTKVTRDSARNAIVSW